MDLTAGLQPERRARVEARLRTNLMAWLTTVNRVASPAPSGPTGSAAPDHAADRAADPGRGAGVAHVGLRTDRGPPGPRVRTARGPGDCATAPAPFRPAAPPGSPGAARAPQCRDLWAAHRADAAAARPS